MRQYAPFYLWATIIAVIAFGLGMRIGTARETALYESGLRSWIMVVPHHHDGLFNWFHG